MSYQSQVNDMPVQMFEVQRVDVTRPLAWVRSGWQDLNHHRGASIAHGLLVTGMGMVILAFASTHIYLMAVAISGFLLVGPVLATGLCELSKRQEQGDYPGFDESLDALSRNGRALWHFAATLLGFSLLWFVISAVILHLFLGQEAPTPGEIIWGGAAHVFTLQQILVYIVTGGVLAFLVFILSVVSVPAIVDRGISASTAMRMSVQVCTANWQAMLVWAALIVFLTGLGFGTFLLGMIVIYPLLGHATWRAYRDLVR